MWVVRVTATGLLLLLMLRVVARPRPALAQATPVADAEADLTGVPPYQSKVSAPAVRGARGRATSTVSRRDLRERLPRSAPDALRYEPGVLVQQTAAGQGSPFVRGRTGQQTVLVFDGMRMNTALYRQGPNQYFFTVDPRSLESIEVVRGGASTRWGSDAIAGVVHAHPREPDLEDDAPLRPALALRAASADGELGGRVELASRPSRRLPLAVLAGGGYREVGRLEGGGALPVRPGSAPLVPRLAADGRTQLGTGFREWAGDLRVLYAHPRARVTAALYDYRQLDAPRTDQCPAPFAPIGECLRVGEQFRTLASLALATRAGAAARTLRATAWYARQHERRTLERPTALAENVGRDDVGTLGLGVAAETAARRIGAARARLRWGGDLQHDRVTSRAWTILTDLGRVIRSSRGQYLDGARYSTGGLYAEAEASAGRFTVRTGARAAAGAAHADGDPESGSAAVDDTWLAAVGHAGVELRAARGVTVLAGVDRSFRAPNLDDLTSRQAVGPGFQFENAALRAERAVTLELGARAEAGPRVTDAPRVACAPRPGCTAPRSPTPSPARCAPPPTVRPPPRPVAAPGRASSWSIPPATPSSLAPRPRSTPSWAPAPSCAPPRRGRAARARTRSSARAIPPCPTSSACRCRASRPWPAPWRSACVAAGCRRATRCAGRARRIAWPPPTAAIRASPRAAPRASRCSTCAPRMRCTTCAPRWCSRT